LVEDEAERRLLVMTNRLPIVVRRTAEGLERRQAIGGLTAALDPVLRKRGGTWVGWPGIELRKGERLDQRGAPYRIAPVSLSETELSRYYHGLSNRSLWPLFHSFPSRAVFDDRDWPVYRRVNRRFADMAVRELREDDPVWIHDYHLMLTPMYLRRYFSRARLSFFLHIPFPPFDLYRVVPWARELLRGLLACDLVGFQVEAYARNFLDCVERLLDARVDRKRFQIRRKGRVIQVGAFPIGIDIDSFEARAREAPPRKGPQQERIILGADRLDYTKGIPERILAIERLLEKHPEHREKVTLLQIGVPSRHQVAEYRNLKRTIEELVGRVNGRFGTADWSPIRYLYQGLSHDRLAPLYRDAEIALVTPLRDGMNLVAKEFVACQVADPGVLVLSHLAGAAETMREAILVNPYDIEKSADRLHRALQMPLEERESRMQALRARERKTDVHAWVGSFLRAAEEAHAKSAE
jgi:trehalose 6-phosphate synthase/phosphatase